MDIVAKPHCAVVFLMVLTLGVSLGLPAEDVLDAVYDESEALPYECVSLLPIATPLRAARTTQAVPNSLHHKLGAPSPFSSARVRDNAANRPTDTRIISLALLCTLLC
jgi:hypothetical protein